MNLSNNYKFSPDYNYHTINDELNFYNKNQKAIEAVLKKYPDAGKMTYKGAPSTGAHDGIFYAPSIVNQKIQLDFEGQYWFTTSICPHDKIEYEYGTINVYYSKRSYNLFTNQFGILTKKEADISWNKVENYLIDFTDKDSLLKQIYSYVITNMNKSHPVKITLLSAGLPEGIGKYLPFV